MIQGPRGGRRRMVPGIVWALVCVATLTPGTAVAAPSPTPKTPVPSTPPEEVRLTPRAQRIGTIADPRIVNPSGIAASTVHKGVLWMLSGGRLYAVNAQGRTLGAYTIGGPPAYNMRALALRKEENGTYTLLLGDIGDANKQRRNGVWIYTVAEPRTLGTGRLTPTRYRVKYPDGPQDAGTLMVDPYDQRAYLVTVSPTGGVLYSVPSVLGARMRNLLAEVRPLYFVAQDGAILHDGRVVLRGRLQAHVLDGIKGARLAYVQLPEQTEYGPVAVSPDGKSLFTVGKDKQSGIWRVDMPAEPGPSFTRGGDTSRSVPQTELSEPSPLPGGMLGTVSLGALAAIAAASGVLWLRRRRHGGTAGQVPDRVPELPDRADRVG